MDLAFLQAKSRGLRRDTLSCIASIGIGHVGGALSIIDILTVLYYGVMKVEPQNPKMEGRDRLVLSKGHGGPALYSVLADKEYFPKSELETLNRLGTNLPSHCDMLRTPGIDMTAGSLGQGFSCAVGIAVGSKIKKEDACVYAIIGDGESQEGIIWEAAMYAAHKKLDNLIAFCDLNLYQIDGAVEDVNSLGDIKAKWESFGWKVQEVDGHDHMAILGAIENAKTIKGCPHMILARTVKGKGVSFIEQAGATNHNMPITKEQLQAALAELAG